MYDSGNKKAAFDYVRAAYAKGQLSGMDQLNYFGFCDNIYRKDYKNYYQCIAGADSMIRICESNKGLKKIQFQYIIAYNNKADALMSLGDYLGAYDCYYQAKKLAQECSDPCGLSKYSYSLSMVLFKQQKYKESAHYFNETFEEVSKCQEDFGVFYKKQELLDNLGLCYYHNNQFDTAVYYYDWALKYIDSNASKFPKKNRIAFVTAKAVIYGNLADIYNAHGQKDTAIALLRKSISVNLQKECSNTDAEIDQIKLANLYFETGRSAALQELLNDIRAELDSLPQQSVSLNWNKLMWERLAAENKLSEAFPYILKYVQINDSITKQNDLLVASDIEGRIKSQERIYQLGLLNKKAYNQRVYLIVVSMAAILSVILIIIILQNATRTRRNLVLLTSLNDKINHQKAALEKALSEVEQRERDKTRILRSVAHDVMNPISAIMALTDILQSDSGMGEEENKEILSLIKQSCENSIALSRDILEAAIILDPNTLKKDWTNINELVHSSVELLHYKASAKHQKIVTNFGKSNINAFVNKEKIWRVLNNLIGNAIKFSFEHTTIEVSVKQLDPSGKEVVADRGSVFDGADKVLITVKDSGVGIPDKHKPLVFDMFTEAKTQGTAGEHAHGLGLSISQQIAKAHGGHISFESKEGVGTTFYFEFPLNDAMPTVGA